MSAERLIAHGTIASQGTAEGVLRQAITVLEVLALMDENPSEAILSVEHASVTAIIPLLPLVRGVVCQNGGVTSHIAIVSRQFGLPCIVAAEYDVPLSEVEGHVVKIDDSGALLLVR